MVDEVPVRPVRGPERAAGHPAGPPSPAVIALAFARLWVYAVRRLVEAVIRRPELDDRWHGE
jgi:hypothetical protein